MSALNQKYSLDHDLDNSESDLYEIKELQSVSSKVDSNVGQLVNNYFYPSLDHIKMKFNKEMTKDDLYSEFGNPYIVCLKDGVQYEPCYYDQQITQSELEKIKQNICIIPSSYKAINGTAFRYLTSMSSEMFNKFNITDKYGNRVVADRDVLLCCLLRFNYQNMLKYQKQFDGISNFIDLYNAMLINEYLGQPNKTSTVRQNHIQTIMNMAESNYYTIHNNCQLNITLKFKSRGFNLALSERLSDQTVRKVLERLSESKEEDNNYLAFLFRKSSYLDASSAVDIKGYKLYKITSTPIMENMTNDHFNALYNKLSVQEKYYLIMNCMISKELCHFVVNNKYILNEITSNNDFIRNSSFMSNFAHLVRYNLGYAWLTMYMEESIKRGYIKSNDRFVFDIETASQLPFFPYTTSNIQICPYLPVLVESETLNAERNVFGVCQNRLNNSNANMTQAKKNMTRYGVADKDTFIKRVNMFISGIDSNNKKSNDILKDIDWSNIAMSGSMMACCLPNYNTLMLKFSSGGSYSSDLTVDFVKFVDEYYRDADIDVMCNITDIYKFVDKIHEFRDTVEANIKHIHELKTDIPITDIYSNKSLAVMINKDFIKVHLVGKIPDMDYAKILVNINDVAVKKIVYEHYIKWHTEYLINSAKENPAQFINPKYHEIYDPAKIENMNVVFINTTKDKEDEAKNQTNTNQTNQTDTNQANIVETTNQTGVLNIMIDEDDKDYIKEIKSEVDEPVDNDEYPTDNIAFIPKINYKFRISSPYLPHSFELFQIRHPEFFSTVARFHLPIVRSYYDGSNVFILPSCVSACMTLLNIDYKYFAGSKDPIEIINKYRMRGFGTILNDREIVRLVEYSSLVPKWKEQYGLDIHSNNSVMKILGTLQLNSPFFDVSSKTDRKIEKTNNENNLSLSNYNTDTQAGIIASITDRYKTNNRMEQMNSYKVETTINKYGYVVPVKKWLIDAYYDGVVGSIQNHE